MEVDGVIRCRGRFENAPLDYSAKYPIFLPKSHQFTELVVLYYHDLVIHDGVKETGLFSKKTRTLSRTPL